MYHGRPQNASIQSTIPHLLPLYTFGLNKSYFTQRSTYLSTRVSNLYQKATQGYDTKRTAGRHDTGRKKGG
jgi:hypothetical protein